MYTHISFAGFQQYTQPKEKGNQNCTGIGSHDGSFRVDSWRISTVSPHLQVNQARVPATREGGPVHVSK